MENIRCTKCNKNWKIENIGQHYETCKPKLKKIQPNIIVGFIASGKKGYGKGSKSLKRELKRLNRVILKQQQLIKNSIELIGAPRISVKVLHPIYDSKKWRDLRYITLKKYGFKCLACKTSNTELHVDHIKPVSKYPELAFDPNNLQVLCKDCNLSKSNKHEDDLR